MLQTQLQTIETKGNITTKCATRTCRLPSACKSCVYTVLLLIECAVAVYLENSVPTIIKKYFITRKQPKIAINPQFVKNTISAKCTVSWNAIKWSMLIMHSVPKGECSLVASIIFIYLEFLPFYIIIFSYNSLKTLCLIKRPTFSTYIKGTVWDAVPVYVKHLKQYLALCKPSVAAYKNICKHKWIIKMLFCFLYPKSYTEQYQWHRNRILELKKISLSYSQLLASEDKIRVMWLVIKQEAVQLDIGLEIFNYLVYLNFWSSSTLDLGL